MSLPKRMAKRREQDAELERRLGVVRNAEDVRYSRDDIEALEYERIGAAWREFRWRKMLKDEQN